MPRNKRAQMVFGTVALCNATAFLSIGSSFLFKHGHELVFGVEARIWGFVVLGITVIGMATAIVSLVTAHKSEP